MGLSHLLWGFVFYFAFCVSRGLVAPVLAHAEQTEIPSGDRASLVSLRSLVFRMTFVAIGPAVGWAIDPHGQHRILIILGIGFVFSAGAAIVPLKRAPGGPRALDAQFPSLE